MNREDTKASPRWRQTFVVLFLTVLLTVPAGCSPQGPSLADLISIYNAELAALDRLEQKRAELVKAYQSELLPTNEDAAKLIGNVLQGAVEAGKTLDLNEMADPNKALDLAVDHAQKTQDTMGQLLQNLNPEAKPDEKEIQRRAKITEKFEAELAAIDKEIEAQKERVEQARKARDAAEAKGR
ncbi:MAG: hypothetical protein JW829_12505 [Pirellulales bacterium]|nr:hypothetical protein [Pirellulales bacterium]